MGVEQSDPPATVAELEEGLRQLHRMEMQTKMQLDRVEALVAAAVKVLHRADIVHEKAIEAEAVEQRTRLYAERADDARIYLGREDDKYTVDVSPVDCAGLMHLCKGRCCRLSVALDFKDLDDGLRWEYSRPYELRRRASDGYCVYSEQDTRRCGCYEKRPSICRTYDCRGDKRIWEDFAAKKPAPWRDDVGVAAQLVQIRMPKSDTK